MILRSRQELFEVVLPVPDVGVQRDVVDIVSQASRTVRFQPIQSALPEVRGPGGDQLDRSIDAAHRLGRLEREVA